MSAVSITYNLHPPRGHEIQESSGNVTNSSGRYPSHLFPSKTHTIRIAGTAASCDNPKEYYSTLRKALLEAKDVVGMELTEWKEAVGNMELQKDKQLPATGAEDEESDEQTEEIEEIA
jgi:hypothetical protein